MYWLVSYEEKCVGQGSTALDSVNRFLLFNTQTRKLEFVSSYDFKRLSTGITKKNGLVKNVKIVGGYEFVTNSSVTPITSDERHITIIEYSDKYFVTLDQDGTLGKMSYEDAWYQLLNRQITNGEWTLNIEYGVLEYFLRGGLCRLPESIEYIPVYKKYMRKINEARKINERNSLLGISNTMHVGSNGYITLMGRPKSIVYDKCNDIVVGNSLNYLDLEVVMIKGRCDHIPSGFLLGADKLKTIQLPTGIRSMEGGVLNDTGLEVIDLRQYKRLSRIGDVCFSFNSNLRELYYPDYVAWISTFLLWGNHNLEVVCLPKYCEMLCTMMFRDRSSNMYNARNNIHTIILPESRCTWSIDGDKRCLRNPSLKWIYTPKINIELAKQIQNICNKKAQIIVEKRT